MKASCMCRGPGKSSSVFPGRRGVRMYVVVMGVAGSGKTTIGKAVAGRLGWPFYDGDDFHPAANVAKMAAGTPLNDEDRAGWLNALAALIRSGMDKGESGVVAC